MIENMEEDESILNFSYLTAEFYNFLTISSKNYDKIDLKKNKGNIDKEFEDVNMENLLDYLGYLSDVTKNDENSKQKKKNLFKSVFQIEFNEKDKEKIFYECSKKMNINALNNKNELLIKLLNQYIINFNFEIYQLFYLIIKKMEKSIEQMTVENLLETDEIRKGKSNKEKELLNENKKLKSKIKIYQQNKENIKSMEDENRKLNDEISKLKENFKKFKIENEKEAFKLNESIENLKIENEKEASKKDSEIKKLNESIKNLKIENEKEANK